MKIMYLANIVVAGAISITSLFYPKTAQRTIFAAAFAYSEATTSISSRIYFVSASLDCWALSVSDSAVPLIENVTCPEENSVEFETNLIFNKRNSGIVLKSANDFCWNFRLDNNNQLKPEKTSCKE